MFEQISMVMVVVSDMDRSVEFYRDVLGLKLGYASPHWSQFEVGATVLGLHPAGETVSVNPEVGVSFGFYVDDLDAVLAEVTGRGARLMRRTDEGFGQLALLADPDGYTVQLCQLKQWGG